jgi:stage II sporulation protein D
LRPILAAFIVLLTAAVASASGQQIPPSAYGEAIFVVSGRGYGHGVGMSQYGAYGQALAGRTYEQILGHYYTGTEIGPAGRKEVRVLLAEGRRAVTISSSGAFSAVDASGATFRFAKGAGALTLDRTLRVRTGAGVERVKAVSPLVVRPLGKSILSLDGHPYRGKLEVVAEGAFLRAVNVVGLESYLQGVVPGEVPHSWPAETLKAQAVAARSYALANLVKGKPFDLYADVRSQVYGGVASEKPSTSKAVAATVGEVVLYGGKVATTFYFSTSGGKTASALDVFGQSVPYLVARPDPWDKASPYHRWGPVLLGARTLQARLGVDARVLDATGVATPSNRLRALLVKTTAASESIPASVVRTALGLRSTWVTVGVLRLDRASTGAVTFGGNTRLTGISRLLGTPRLESSADGSAWTDAGAVTLDTTGAVTVDVAPVRNTRYRLGAEGGASAALLVPVAPRIQLTRPTAVDPYTLRGAVRPRVRGAVVEIARRRGSVWAPIGQATVDASGEFVLELDTVVPPGAYRAQIAATAGFAEGLSPVLQVSG